MTSLSAHDIASLSLHNSKNFALQLNQTEHRIELLSKWNIAKGAKVLELGCGQGDCTAVLADAVGPDGHVTAIDPGPLTYGAPYTLGQAQSHLSSGILGDRITWKEAVPLEFLESDDSHYDVAVLAHCIWYFASPAAIRDTLRVLTTRAQRICIAEWSLSSTTAGTHVLAALTQAALECRKPASVSNVRTVVSPTAIKSLAKEVGLTMESEMYVMPGKGVLDGKWEVGAVMDPGFLRQVDEFVVDEREKSVVVALRDAMEASLTRVDGGIKGVVAMDVWCAVFSKAT